MVFDFFSKKVKFGPRVIGYEVMDNCIKTVHTILSNKIFLLFFDDLKLNIYYTY